MFVITYYIVAFLLYLVFVPYLFIKARNSKYKQSIPARFFLKNNPPFSKKDLIWFHSCSFGETKALEPLLAKLDNSNFAISTTTNTGYTQASSYTKEARYLPFEIFLPFWIKKQKALVVMEAEFWLLLFYVAKKRGTKTLLINARISDNSFKSYMKFKWFYKQIFKQIDFVFAQTHKDKERLLSLGAKNVIVNGNIKLANKITPTKQLKKPDCFVIVGASTHKNEEELILKSYNSSLGKLIMVPRHPERFDSVDNLLKEFAKENNLTYHRYSQKNNFDSDIVLIDKLGELINIYSIADVVVLGGSFEPIGGHNPIEPATFNTVLISGKHIFNQESTFKYVKDYYIIENEELPSYLSNCKNLAKSKLIETNNILEPILKHL